MSNRSGSVPAHRTVHKDQAGAVPLVRGSFPPRLIAIAAAIALVLVVFPEVIFLGGSLSPTQYVDALAVPGLEEKAISFYPERPGRSILDGAGDVGGAGWQLVPAQKFLARCLRTGMSPFWDPWTGMGAYGPEILADVKFSFISLVMAAIGPTAAVQTFVLLLVCVASIYFLIRLLREYMDACMPAAMAAAAVFLLNGFALANLNSAIGQPYFVAPLALYSVFRTYDTPGRKTFLWSTLAHIILLSISFIPVLILTLLFIHAVGLVFAFTRRRDVVLRNPGIVLLQFGTVILAGLALAVLYLPAAEALLFHTRTVNEYNQRLTPGISLMNLLSEFTPKHFWESYRAMRIPASWPVGHYEMFVFHVGVAAFLTASQAFSTRNRMIGLCGALLYLIAVGQIFGVFPFSLLDRLPFFSFVRNDYWASLSALAMVLLVGLGLNNSAFDRVSGLSLAFCAMTVFGSFAYLAGMLGGLPAAGPARLYVPAFLFIAVSALALVILSRMTHGRVTVWLLFVLILAEGIFYENGLRPVRTDRDEHLSPALAQVRDNVRRDGSRILNIGSRGIHPNWGAALGIPQADNLNISQLPWYWQFYHRYIGSGLYESLNTASDTLEFTRETLSVAGIRYVIVDRQFEEAVKRVREQGLRQVGEDGYRFVFENDSALPKVSVADAVIMSNGLPHEAKCSYISTVTTEDSGLIEEAGRLGVLTGQCGDNRHSGRAQLISYSHTGIRLRASTSRPAIILVGDNWHPNWGAEVNGKKAPLARVNVTFRGVPVSAGEHEIEIRYSPRSLTPALSVSTLACLSIVLLAIPGRLWSRLSVAWRRRGQHQRHVA